MLHLCVYLASPRQATRAAASPPNVLIIETYIELRLLSKAHHFGFAFLTIMAQYLYRPFNCFCRPLAVSENIIKPSAQTRCATTSLSIQTPTEEESTSHSPLVHTHGVMHYWTEFRVVFHREICFRVQISEGIDHPALPATIHQFIK